jgi:LDH2 family malate/lactate/ureidoglycolate dehydrogenase
MKSFRGKNPVGRLINLNNSPNSGSGVAMSDIIVYAQQASNFCIEAFVKLGVPEPDAQIVAANLVEGELRGLGSHGLSRMIFYTNKLEAGGFKTKPEIKIVEERTATLLVDADNAMGAVAGSQAMNICIKKAKSTGIAGAAVKNGNHFGIASFYSMMALDKEMIGIAMCNSVAKMAVYGGIDPVLGTNPLSIAVPAGRRYPLVFDAATSEVALGKIMVADIEGKPIPAGWAVDREGNPTQNPKRALKGALLPFGGYKGSGLAVMIDVFTALLSGALFGTHTGELRSDPEKGQDVGFFFGAIDIAAFQEVASFKSRMDQMITELKASRIAEGATGIYMPGELEFLKKEQFLKDGFKIGPGVFNNLMSIKNQFGLKESPEDWLSNNLSLKIALE